MMKVISLTCDDEQLKWLSKHPEVNRSGAFRALVNYMMTSDKTVLSQTDLRTISGELR